MTATRIATKFAAIALAATAATAGDNLLVNGDAELGDMTGWFPIDLNEVVDSANPSDNGLPDGESLGKFCFTGGLGPEIQVCAQTIDLTQYAALIDGGCFTLNYRGLLQARQAGGATDTIEATFEFVDDNANHIASTSYVDTHIVNGVFDWDLFEDTQTAPGGARALVVTLTTTRVAGLSSDGYADNLSVTIAEDTCPADINNSGTVDVDDLLALLAAWGPAIDACDTDIVIDGTINVDDLLALLAAWGPCK